MIAGLLFMAGMRRSEVSTLRWADVADAADGGRVLVTVRRSKTNQEGETTDVRFVKGGVARAIRTLRAAASPTPAPADGGRVLVTVRRSKTNQEGETTDVRFVKGGVARAIRTLRAAASPAPADRVAPLSPKMVGLRFQAAARAAGVEHVTAHSGRVPNCSARTCVSS